MITVSYKNTKVYVNIELPMGTFPFSFDAQVEWAAQALFIILRDKLEERVRNVRKEEYYAGIKDARKKKGERREWFGNMLLLDIKK